MVRDQAVVGVNAVRWSYFNPVMSFQTMKYSLALPSTTILNSLTPREQWQNRLVISYRSTSRYGGSCYLFKIHVSLPISSKPSTVALHEHTSDKLDLSNPVAVTQDNTDLRGSSTLFGELADLVNHLVGGGLEPRRGGTRVGDGRGRNALSLAVKTTHFDVLVVKKKVPEGKCRRVVARSKKSKFIFWRNFFCGIFGRWSVGHVNGMSRLKRSFSCREKNFSLLFLCSANSTKKGQSILRASMLSF